MTNRYYYFLLLPILSFIVVVSTGFWYVNKSTNSADNTFGAMENGDAPYIHPIHKLDPDTYEAKIARLETSLKNFKNAKTFKAIITESHAEGKLYSELDYVKPLRLQAMVTVDDKATFEMIIVGETAYARLPEDAWKMTNDETIRAFGRSFFESMIATGDTLQSFGIDEGAQYDIKQKAKDNCLNFATLYKVEEGNYPISFCINDRDQIVKIVKKDKEGEITTRFSDHNKFFNIERPVLPLLAPTLKFEIIDVPNNEE
jgi:mRNA-degrading endonuclease RelE of RelBE toxin-antitoxin system